MSGCATHTCVCNYENITRFTDYYIKGLNYYNQAIIQKANAENNYDYFSVYYTDVQLEEAQKFCVDARDYFEQANTEYTKAVASFSKAQQFTQDKKYIELIGYYQNISGLAIKINWALYEACEYFETAIQAYLKDDKVGGDSALASGNEKIKIHDSYIEGYNQLISHKDLIEEE